MVRNGAPVAAGGHLSAVGGAPNTEGLTVLTPTDKSVYENSESFTKPGHQGIRVQRVMM